MLNSVLLRLLATLFTRLQLANSSLAANGLPHEGFTLPTVDSSQDPTDLPSVPSHAFVDNLNKVIRSFLYVVSFVISRKTTRPQARNF